ncbi:MAG: biliverdin-producing heme oxygenase [Cyanobacteria bacterium P01_A01_bin.135]
MTVNLATELRSGTKKAHTMAENVGFVKCFLKGVVEKRSYRKLASSLYFVYSEMEEQLQRHCRHPALSPIYFPLLYRRSSLEKDLAYYYGTDWQAAIAPSEGATAYVERIREVAASEPELLIAHAYTRYLGDLSGGQILKGIAQRAMNLNGGEGTAFYEFEDIADETEFKVLYRQRLNELPVDRAMAERIVAEANAAFEMNMRLFQELEGSLVKAIGQLLFRTLTRRRERGSTGLAAAE